MARMMLKSPDRSGWGGANWNSESSARNAGRRGWASTAWLVAGTLAVALTSYSLSLKVSSERRETDRIARQNRALEADLKAMDAELRVRMRMPQLQRWNDQVLGLVPISASQYLGSPVHLADYGKPLQPALPTGLPRVQLAVRDVPLAANTPPPRLVSATRPATPDVAPLLVAAPAVPAAPADLLQQVEMMVQAPPGLNAGLNAGTND
jgi:hypothetical protein